MNKMIVLLKFLIFCLPFVAVGFVAFKTNLKKKNRYQQVFMPLIAVVYCVLVMIFIDDVIDIIDVVITFIEKLLPFLDLRFGLVFVVNTAIIVGFFFVKIFALLLCKVLSFIPFLTDFFSGFFYCVREEDAAKADGDGEEDAKRHYLKSKFRDAKKIFTAMYVGSLIVGAIVMLVTAMISSDTLVSKPAYPVVGILVLGEIVFFMNGLTYEEVLEKEEIEEEPEETETDYETLIDKYRDLYGSRLIENCRDDKSSDMNEASDDLLEKYKEEYEKTLDQEANIMYRYFSAVKENGVSLDEGYISQTKNIIDGKSVLFCTMFYDDTTDYVFLPVIRHLMRREKILIITPNGGEANASKWFADGMEKVNNFRDIWKVVPFAEIDADTFVSVIETKNTYNHKLLNAKESFLAEATMVFIVEPSRMLGSMQLGLSTIVSYLRRGGNDPQYIMYDRNCDGLVDSLSHVLGKSLVQVNATAVGTAKKNMLFWRADGKMMHHKLGLSSSRYLGMGTELALVALKEKVSNVVWASSEKFPVTDMKWIASQYYAPLCGVAGLKLSQNELSDHLDFNADPCSITKSENSLIVAEDELNNAFEVARQYLTRGSAQSFVNVISSAYWLREYMMDNSDIFVNDPKSIPNITPDYQRSVCNVVYKLMSRMINAPVPEDEVRDALDLIGEDTDRIYNTLRGLILRYFFRVDGGDAEKSVVFRIDSALSVTTQIVVDPKTMRPERKRFYSIGNKAFVDEFMSQLKIIYYLAEDETDKTHFTDSALYGHVFQKYLPGMFTTFEGKYYEIINMTKSNGIIVRRASDHINARHYYRVIRDYTVTGETSSNKVGTRYTYGNIVFERTEADIKVETYGYYDLTDYHNLAKAKKVLVSGIEDREYRTKNVIKVAMNGSSEAARTTVAALLNELFVSVFPHDHQYIAATTKHENAPFADAILPGLTVVSEDGGKNAGDGFEFSSDDCIYIIEDSLMDLGLLENVERYFTRFLEIICDVLNWHKEKLDESKDAPAEGPEEMPFDGGDDENAGDGGIDDMGIGDTEEDGGKKGKKKKEKKKKKSFFAWIKDKFRRKKKSDDAPDEGTVETAPYDEMPQTEDEESDVTEGNNDFGSAENNDAENGPDDVPPMQDKACVPLRSGVKYRDTGVDTSGIEGDDSESVSSDDAKNAPDEVVLPYKESHYMLYGFESVPSFLDLEGTSEYLNDNGFEDNYLKQSRESNKFRRLQWYNYHFEPGVHYCDFCGAVLGKKYDILDDGRERCRACSDEAITKVSDFTRLYKETRKDMERIFGIKLKTKIKIRMCNAKRIAEELGETFVATPGFDCRTLGFAVRGGRKSDIYIENGAPRIETAKTLVHEMTHTWQYENIPELFNGEHDLSHTEGMAVWAEVQYLMSIGLKDRAVNYIYARLQTANEYGLGLKMYLEKFKVNDGKTAAGNSPFKCSKDPLE